MRSISKIFVITLALCFVVTALAFSAGIKERMKQRLPQIVALKNKGIVGETNTGYLGFVTAKKAKQGVINAENKDRKAIYAKIAKQQKVSIQLVQKRRAASLFSNGVKGHYYQNQAGAWVKK